MRDCLYDQVREAFEMMDHPMFNEIFSTVFESASTTEFPEVYLDKVLDIMDITNPTAKAMIQNRLQFYLDDKIFDKNLEDKKCKK